MTLRTRMSTAAVGAAVVALGIAPASAPLAAGTLELRATFGVSSDGIACPPDASPNASDCRTRSGSARVPGLGTATLDYVWSYATGAPVCPDSLTKPLATSGRIVVAGKGELHFTLAPGAQCVDLEPVRNEPQNFTITGGTGAYQSASGSGSAERSLSGGVGTETWTGTLAAPGVEFDRTPPTLSGAKAKTVRAPKGAKRVRVTYRVTASDDVDDVVPASCEPRSGSRFPIGRTLVRCTATDSSANTGTASFRVTVKAAK